MKPATWFMGTTLHMDLAIVWWILGIFMMWFLAYKLEMSTNVPEEFEALRHDILRQRVETEPGLIHHLN